MDRDEKLRERIKTKKKRLLDLLILNEILKDKRLIKAFIEVPLEKFIPDKYINVVKLYEDVPNLFYYDEHNPRNYRTISAPHMISIMLQGLALDTNDDLLILGAKSGYIAALAHKLAPKGEIVILEANSEIAKITSDNLKKLNLDDNITIILKNPLDGMPELSPWQKILVTGAIEQSKIHALLNQLDENGGVLFAPIGLEFVQTYTQILRQNDEFYGKKQLQVKFSPLITQVELDDIELITDLEEFEIKDDPMKVDETLKPFTQKLNIKYTKDILDDVIPEQPVKIEAVDKKELDLILSFLVGIEKNVKNLKKEEDIDNCFNCVDEIEIYLNNLKKYKKSFEIKIKRMQNLLNQIRSCNIVRKELEKKAFSDSQVIDKKIDIINKQLEHVDDFLELLRKEIRKIKSI